MAISEVEIPNHPNQGITFPDSALAHELLDHLTGIEAGASSHNSFHLPGSKNLAPMDDEEKYKKEQANMNGKIAVVDHYGDADDLDFLQDNSIGYVINSHVFEHLPNPIKALLEWFRVIRDKGYIFLIVPQRGAQLTDVGRNLTTFAEWRTAYEEDYTVASMPADRTAAAGGERGHYWVYSSDSLKALFTELDSTHALKLVAEEDPDSKVRNGFTLVYQLDKSKTLQLVTQEGITPMSKTLPSKPVKATTAPRKSLWEAQPAAQELELVGGGPSQQAPHGRFPKSEGKDDGFQLKRDQDAAQKKADEKALSKNDAAAAKSRQERLANPPPRHNKPDSYAKVDSDSDQKVVVVDNRRENREDRREDTRMNEPARKEQVVVLTNPTRVTREEKREDIRMNEPTRDTDQDEQFLDEDGKLLDNTLPSLKPVEPDKQK